MKLDDDDRIARSARLKSNPFIALVLTSLLFGGLALLAFPELRENARRTAYTGLSAVGVNLPLDDYARVYERLGIEPLPAGLVASSKISSGLSGLAREGCDKGAISSLGAGLVANGERRRAANAYLGFATVCPNADGEKNRAAQLFFDLGDYDKAIALWNSLISTNPSVANYRYFRGKALAGSKRYPEALVDYMSTIELQNDPRQIREQVFVEMANIYVALGKPCDAATMILAWVALDPAKRNNLKAHKMIADYAGQSCRQSVPPVDVKKL